MGRCMLPGIERHRLRAKTAPPGCWPALKAKLASHCDLRPPETLEVQRQLAVGGSSVTLMDVAVGVVERLMNFPGCDPDELNFVCDCLKADRSKTALPCGLVTRQDSTDGIGRLLLSTYGDTPKSAVSHSIHMTPQSDDEEGETVSSWPVACLNKVVALELEELFDASFDEWSFDSFELSRLTHCRPLQFTGWEALRRNSFFSKFDIAPEKAQCFLRRVELGYGSEQAIPYHNNVHAADVTQSVHALLCDIGLSACLDPFSCFTLLLSAAIHDMGHDGRNNSFHTSMQDDLALTYNDCSILENYHASQAFRLLSGEPEANLLSSLGRERLACARKQMIEAVLGTDMAHHFSKVGAFKEFVEKLDDDPKSWLENAEAMASLRVMILHAADISGPAKTLDLADRWAALLSQELFAQGDEEKRLQVPVSPLCNRETTKFAGSQVSFIRFIVQPTFQVLGRVAPRVEEAILDRVNANIDLWEERKTKDEESS
mmetsp:Transcript_50869/g.147680  ORF Transcript_50869/g.147680 Transcript_50869/m.147680 type:complete len:488 (+) Transcript_50869:158-1621(+)